MTDLSDAIGVTDVALALALVVVATVVSRWRGAGLERDLGIATLRSFAQLLAVGFVLEFVLGNHRGLMIVVLGVMLAVATVTAAGRARLVPNARLVAALSIAAATAATLGLLVVLGIVPLVARAVVPLGSMIISGAMNTTALVMTRLRDDMAAGRREIEARLCLGWPSRRAAAPLLRRSLRAGMLPSIDQTKVVGLVALPGAMTGMILAGAPPLAAIRLQLVVMYMLLAGNAVAALVAGEMTTRRLFTPAHQLVRSLRRVAG